jgi:hypothetical protein
MNPATDTPGSPALTTEQFIFLREEIRHEDNLINQRLSWLVSSQSFLLTGFAIALNGPVQSKFPDYEKLTIALVDLLPAAGILTCILSFITIWAALIRMKTIRQLAGHTRPPHMPPVHGTDLTRKMGLSGPVLTPLIFLAVRLVLLLKRF